MLSFGPLGSSWRRNCGFGSAESVSESCRIAAITSIEAGISRGLAPQATMIETLKPDRAPTWPIRRLLVGETPIANRWRVSALLRASKRLRDGMVLSP